MHLERQIVGNFQKSFSIIEKTNIPYWHRVTKDHYESLPVRLMGIIVHGHATLGYFLPGEFLSDSNVTIECLSRALLHLGLDFIKGKTMYLQLDNTAKDNKNEKVFAFVASLVSRGFIDAAEIHFLPVGHTHEVSSSFNQSITSHRNH